MRKTRAGLLGVDSEGSLLLFEELILTRGCSSGLVGFHAFGSRHWFSSEKKIFFHLKNCQECLSRAIVGHGAITAYSN